MKIANKKIKGELQILSYEIQLKVQEVDLRTWNGMTIDGHAIDDFWGKIGKHCSLKVLKLQICWDCSLHEF